MSPPLSRLARRRRQVGELDAPRLAAVVDLDHRHQVEAQQRQVGEVVAAEAFAAQVGVHQAQAAETADAAAQAADVGNLDLVRVADDDVAHRAFAGEQHADLAAEVGGERRQVAGELQGDHLLRLDAAPEGALEGAPLGGLDALQVTVDVGCDRSLDRRASRLGGGRTAAVS